MGVDESTVSKTEILEHARALIGQLLKRELKQSCDAMSLEQWKSLLSELGIVRNRDRFMDRGDFLALDLGGCFWLYPKKLLLELVQSASHP